MNKQTQYLLAIIKILGILFSLCFMCLNNPNYQNNDPNFYEQDYIEAQGESTSFAECTRGRGDLDNDGVEDQNDAFPNDPAAAIDSDSDGCPDAWNHGKNQNDSTSSPKLELDMFPFDPGACLDTDGDNLPNEITGTSNLTEDTDDDNDGMPDSWETTHLLDPLNPDDAMNDPDGDGFSNLNEYLGGTNPVDANSIPFQPQPKPVGDETDWVSFAVFLVMVIIITMVISIIIGIYIANKRQADEEFWTGTFGDERDITAGGDIKLRDRYLEWQKKVDSETRVGRLPRDKIKLEVIGGPDEPVGQIARSSKLKDPRFKGRNCMWCDSGITSKYIKRCPEKRLNKRTCTDGPFCSRKCLNEHLQAVPHFREFIY